MTVTDLLAHAVVQTWLMLAILALVGAWQAAGDSLGAFLALFRHDWLAGHAVRQT
jgi:hypothetical protein